ncbi:cation:proton antiporter [Actinokineospora iranica]|uniref:Potassium/proton antiporter membrane subunit, CPA2 family n=1 Tax=Actinokineospora iranica TaxID=1271860 RepID=A0A1G6JSS0_9PSEU|nr:cation:proton antiporter [Actinokineospora iranica]SDC21485.1 potassium/proton antiporter membrane subunit, CPA2 family [Actinokineospora iranica]
MQVSVALLLELGLVLLALTVLGGVARSFALTPVPLYLLAGLALGEGGIAPVPAANGFIDAGASIGVVLLLLTLGLEFSLTEFRSGVRRHRLSAAVDLGLNAVPGAVAGWLLGLDGVGVLALAGATYVSSSGIIARLLADLRRLGNRETPAVLSVLVMEDFAMAVYLPLLAVLAAGGTWWQAAAGVAVAVGALAVAFAASQRWGHHLGRLIAHPDPEQLLLRVLGVTLVVAALAELVHASAAVGAFLVGLTLTGETADRARIVLAPLRDLFAAVFFLAIGLSIGLADLLPVLPVAAALAAVTAATKVLTGRFAAAREGVGRRGRVRAGTALVARGEFSIVIVGLVGAGHDVLGPVVTAYVLILAVAGPLLTRFADSGRRPAPPVARRRARPEGHAPTGA